MVPYDAVSALLRQVAADVVMPSYRRLSQADIAEKSPGEVVTRVDCEAEARLCEGLDALGIGARVIGEEACGNDPALLEQVGKGLVWLVDPLDGTANYADGQGPFGLMLALVADGIPEAAWLLDPVTGRLCQARRGHGAQIGGAPVQIAPRQRGLPVAALATQFMPAAIREALVARAKMRFQTRPIPRCAAESYPRLVTGEDHVALFQRILPWDHAAGVLFLEEAGGVARHWDGSPYRVGSHAPGLLCTASDALWELAYDVLAPELLRVPARTAIAGAAA